MTGYPSPNHNARRDGVLPSLVVVHYTVLPCAEARARLCDPSAEVSAHWLISEQGRLEALVPEEARAWHAGAGAWQGVSDINSHSIGIELANSGDQPFAEPQIAALEDLLRGILSRWSIPPHRVIGHSDMAPDRKSDPGARFDWQRLALQGLAATAHGQGDPSVPLEDSLTRIGYPPAPRDCRLRAFRLRARPWAHGPESPEDRALADAFARSAPRA